MSAKVKLLLSWRYKTLAFIKRHKNHLSLSFIQENVQILNSLFPGYSNQMRCTRFSKLLGFIHK